MGWCVDDQRGLASSPVLASVRGEVVVGLGSGPVGSLGGQRLRACGLRAGGGVMFGPLGLVVRLVGRVGICLADLHDPACPALVEVELSCGHHPDGWAVHVWPTEPARLPALRADQSTPGRADRPVRARTRRRRERVGSGPGRTGRPGRSARVVMAVLFVWRRPRLGGALIALGALWWALGVPGVVVTAVGLGAGLGAVAAGRAPVVSPGDLRPGGPGQAPPTLPADVAVVDRRPPVELGSSPQDRHRPATGHRGSSARNRRSPSWSRSRSASGRTASGCGCCPARSPPTGRQEIEGIAHTLGAGRGRVRVTGPSRISLELAHHDPLAAVVRRPARPEHG